MTGRSRHTGGFTLIEVLVVILIISILVTLVASGVGVVIRKGYTERTKTDMKVIWLAIETYREETGVYPPPKQMNIVQLRDALMNCPEAARRLATLSKVSFPEDRNKGFQDHFGTTLEYAGGGPAGSPRLISWGPDGKEWTRDDIESDPRTF